MCGITGVVQQSAVSAVLANMLERVSHRGPDGQGLWTHSVGPWQVGLGHQRLAIIDVAHSPQPMSTPDRKHHITYNGEVYNFQELRRALENEGQRFSTEGDTEVVLRTVTTWGAQALGRLNGMFAFGIWNDSGELLLARDRVGIKPLYYASLPDGGLVFASELTAILEHPRISRVVCEEGLTSYFFSDYAHAPTSMVHGVKKLPPGHYVQWNDGRLSSPQPFWKLSLDSVPLQSVSKSTIRELAHTTWKKLEAAVTRHLVSDVPVGIFLSGGIDSSVVATLAKRAYPKKLQTFSIGFRDRTFDESSYARLVAKQLHTDHVEEILHEGNVLETLEPAISALDEPIADHSIVPTFLLSRLASRHVKVVLGGDGGDELFGGYPTYKAHRMASWYGKSPGWIRNQTIPFLARKLRSKDNYQSFEWKLKRFSLRWDDDLLRRHLRWMSNTDLLGIESAFHNAEEPATLRQPVPVSPDTLARVLALDFLTYLPGSVLAKVDRASMAHGLEVRPPFLDNEILSWAFLLPSDAKLHHGKGKYVLKVASKDELPLRVLQRPKQGFSIPLARWLRGPLEPRVRSIMNESPLWEHGALHRHVFQQWFDAHLAREGDHSKTLWACIVLDQWMRKEGVSAPNA